MIHYPWNLLMQTLSEKGRVDISIHGLEGLDLKEIFEFPSVAILREIQLQVNNPDLSDSEKVSWIQSLLE